MWWLVALGFIVTGGFSPFGVPELFDVLFCGVLCSVLFGAFGVPFGVLLLGALGVPLLLLGGRICVP